ncbi:hypothetical protein [Arundinibacter roseus]|uniref:Uncharacterized protein n=1 Tax=Arundinibacter roseus TaxID=2070510 RepID=A0A4R4KLC7_9BACT|nr:hypothetical protein [Arundinibacter roseus]TDB69058.1 hypothetical protein EZE20_01615 [Arundinibacter roseus]
MNQTFNLHRFGLMVRLELAEKGQSYLLSILPILLFLFAMMVPITFSKEYNSNLEGLHPAALLLSVFLGGSFYTSLAFNQYGAPANAISEVMIPASRLEKFFCAWFLNLLFIIPLFGLFILLSDWTTNFANHRLSQLGIREQYVMLPAEMRNTYFLFYIIINGLVFLGSIYFKESAYLKTLGLTIALFIVLLVGNQWFARYLTSFPKNSLHISPFEPGWQIVLEESSTYHNIMLAPAMQTYVNFLPFLVLVALWYITYIRLTEREI